jgi:hypothetical protein
VSYYTYYICEKCGEKCRIEKVKDGSFHDDAYGMPKWFNTYRDVSECCNADIIEMDDLEFQEYEKERWE